MEPNSNTEQNHSRSRSSNIECCDTCAHLLAFPRKNAYGDVDYLCPISTYYVANRKADIHKYKKYSPGGRELPCHYKKKSNSDYER